MNAIYMVWVFKFTDYGKKTRDHANSCKNFTDHIKWFTDFYKGLLFR